VEILEYLDAGGVSRFAAWFDELDASAAAKVTGALQRMRQGNLSNVKGVGGGCSNIGSTSDQAIESISEETETLSSCCSAAGRSSGNSRDIETAQSRWADYRRRKGK